MRQLELRIQDDLVILFLTEDNLVLNQWAQVPPHDYGIDILASNDLDMTIFPVSPSEPARQVVPGGKLLAIRRHRQPLEIIDIDSYWSAMERFGVFRLGF